MKQRMSDLIQSEKNVKLRNNKHEKEADVDTKIELSDRESQEKRYRGVKVRLKQVCQTSCLCDGKASDADENPPRESKNAK